MTRGAAEVGSAANSYEILAKLAAGGMAEIFLARGASVGNVERYVVLKRILRHRAGDAQLVRMFLDEARLAAQLQHANIAQVFDVGKLGDSYFFTMEYVHGETLRALLQRSRALRRSIPINCVLTIAAGAAAGLHYAHERVGRDGRPLGIVHRDVSPANLMVSFDGNVKLVDFGVAKAADRMVETRSGTVKGKISYLSPEQCKGGSVDRRCDLFALGIVMWEMLTTERLYRRATDFEVMTSIVTEPPPPPSSRRNDVPPELDAIVLRLLHKDRDRRFQTAAELVEALEGVSVQTASVLSTASVGRYLRELFGQRPEPWVELQSLEGHDGAVTVTGEPVLPDQGAPSVIDQQLANVRELGPPRHQLEASGPIAPPVPRPTSTSVGQPPVTITVVAQSIENLVAASPAHLAPTLIAPPITDDAGPPPMPEGVINPSARTQRQSGPQIPLTGDPARTLPGVGGGTGPRASLPMTSPFESPTTPFEAQRTGEPQVSRRVVMLYAGALVGVVTIALAVWLATRPTGMPHEEPPPPPPAAPVAAVEIDAAAPLVIVVDAAPVAMIADAAPVAPVDVAEPPVAACDADALRAKGTEFVNMGQYGAGLAEFQKSLACKRSLATVRLAYMAACQAGDATAAKELFARIPAAQQGNLAQICLRNKIDPTTGMDAPAPSPPKRAEPPDLNKLFQANRYADIVAACANAAVAADRAAICVLAACHVHDAVKAKKWLRAVAGPTKRTNLTNACHTAGTALEPPPPPPAPPHTPPKDAGADCDPNDILSCQHAAD